MNARRDGEWILLGIAGVVILAFLAIAVGLVIHDDGTGINVSETFATWVEEIPFINIIVGETPAISFPTQSAGTVRGEMCAVGEDGSLYLRTDYGVCRVGKNESGYKYNGWAVELAPDITVHSMALYDDFLYLACGTDGMFRVDTTRGNRAYKIIDDCVTSFVIAEDRLFYLAMDYREPSYYSSPDQVIGSFGLYGELYTAGLDGRQRWRLGEPGHRAIKHQSSADFVYLDGYLYFFDAKNNLKRMRADGTECRVVVERERLQSSFVSCGLYENGGILYLQSENEGIYAYHIKKDRIRKVTDAQVSHTAPILFVGDTLLYREQWKCVWHQLAEGKDTVYKSPFNDADLWMQAVGAEELFEFHEQNGYYDVSFSNGKICAEEPVRMDYDTMPAVDRAGTDPVNFGEEDAQTNCRAARLVYEQSDEFSVYEDHVIFRLFSDDYRVIGLAWTYVDEEGEHTERLVDGEVRSFLVRNDVLYYIMWDDIAESASLYSRELDGEREAVCLIDGGLYREFYCCDGVIYYRNINDRKLYRYTLDSEENEPISDVKIGCYDIWNDTIYYENVSDRTLCKMRLDGTGAEQIDTPIDGEVSLYQLTVCPYRGTVYFACMTESSDHLSRLLVFAEDGSMVQWSDSTIFTSYDLTQTLYYKDGCLYYSTDLSMKICVFDFDEYFYGGGGIWTDSDNRVFCAEDMISFEVTDDFVYVRLYLMPYIIKVYDRRTGRLVQEIDCRDFYNL